MISKLFFVIGAVAASNSTNVTSAPVVTTTLEPFAACDALPGTTNMLGAGQQRPTCCSAQKTLTAYKVFTDPLYAAMTPLITSCVAYGNLCINSTVGVHANFTPTANANAWALGHMCATDAGRNCVSEWLQGLYDNKANNSLNALVIGGANYTDSCKQNYYPAAIGLGAMTQAQADALGAAIEATELAVHAANVPTTTTAAPVVAANTTAAPAAAVTTAAPAAAAAAANTTTIKGSLTIGFTVPANTTAADLNNNTNFKTAMAKTIRKSLTSLPASATVTITKIEAATSSRRARSLATLKLKVSYEITLPKDKAAAVIADIVDNKAAFEKAVMDNSAAEFTAAGLTGYTVDSVVASAPVVTNGPAAAPAAVLADKTSSGASANYLAASTLVLAAVSAIF